MRIVKLTDEEEELIASIRNAKRAQPESRTTMIFIARRLFDELIED